jgi:large subunit ribosomal protein L19
MTAEENKEKMPETSEATSDAVKQSEPVPHPSEPSTPAAVEEAPVPAQPIAKLDIFNKIRPGYTVAVSQMVPQGDKERVQVFEGIVIAKRGKHPVEKTITVRKIAEGGIGVEKIFPISAPTVKEIKITHEGRARRSKLYFLRGSLKKMRELREK